MYGIFSKQRGSDVVRLVNKADSLAEADALHMTYLRPTSSLKAKGYLFVEEICSRHGDQPADECPKCEGL